ncbi:hypothetical protein LSAT2_009205 [Lamellibrachia satsuma]|nr:hypothetical protein LSAT2_009205 [Lamellibrachia satsuma]
MLKKLVGHNVCPDDPAINTKSTDDGDTSRTGTDDSDSSQTGTDDSDASQTGTDDRDASKTGRDNGSPLLLMLWAILRHNFELAKLIWRQGKEGIAAALLAVKLVKAMENKEHDPVKKEKLLEMMVYFERLAVGVLTQCHNTDERKTQQLLTFDNCHTLPRRRH